MGRPGQLTLLTAARIATILGPALASVLPGAFGVGCSSGGTHAAPDAGVPEAGTGDAGPPSLAMLGVTGASSSLVPAFSSDIHDYYVRCAAGAHSLDISMTASAGATSALLEPTPSSAAATQTIKVTANEGDAIVAVAKRGTQSTEYWVRCLPHDFPEVSVQTFDAGAPTPGYYLLGNATVSVSEGGYAMAIDVHGVPVWYHPLATGLAVTDVDNIVDGGISFIPTSFTSYYPFQMTQLEAGTTEPLTPSDAGTVDEHELQVLANGHFLVLTYPSKGGFDLTGLELPKAFDAGFVDLGPNSTIQDCTIVEFDASGTVYWTWSASDHFDPAKDSTFPQTGFGPSGDLPDGGTAYDVFHCNAIDVDPANQNLLVSARGMDSVFYIDKSSASGTVLWKMGGATASKDGATYVSVADPFFRQHDARLVKGWQPACHGGSGQVSLFDDETGEVGPARAVTYDVVVGGGDSAGCGGGAGGGSAGEATVAWQYKGGTVSGGGGSVRVAGDAGHVVGWGIGSPVLTEVDGQGDKLLEVTFPAGNVSYRAIKVPLAAFDLATLRSQAGK